MSGRGVVGRLTPLHGFPRVIRESDNGHHGHEGRDEHSERDTGLSHTELPPLGGHVGDERANRPLAETPVNGGSGGSCRFWFAEGTYKAWPCQRRSLNG